MYRLRNSRQFENDNKKLKVEQPYKLIKQYINKQINLGLSPINIEIEDHDSALRLSEIPLELLDFPNQFVYLNITLSGFYTDQEDFNTFCNKFTTFRNLDSLSLRFYNKRVVYLDSLFRSVAKIRKVSLNLNGFRKIRFESDLKDLLPTIEDFEISLKNTTFKTMEDKNSFENFLVNLRNFTKFRIFLKSADQLKLLLALHKNIQIFLKLNSRDIDLTFCDLLISLKDEYNLYIVEVESNFVFLNAYLFANGFNIKGPYRQQNPDKILTVDSFTEQDIQFMSKVPQFFNGIDGQGVFTFKGLNEPVQKCGKRYFEKLLRIVIPIMHSVNHFRFIYYFGFRKEGRFWSVDHSLFQSDHMFDKLYPHLTTITLNFCFTDKNSTIMQSLMKKIRQMDYLIYVHSEYYYPSDENKLQLFEFQMSIIEELVQILKSQIHDRLRYFAFQKYISDLIPISQQIFYDLLDK